METDTRKHVRECLRSAEKVSSEMRFLGEAVLRVPEPRWRRRRTVASYDGATNTGVMVCDHNVITVAMVLIKSVVL